jgi:hypothetical protein
MVVCGDVGVIPVGLAELSFDEVMVGGSDGMTVLVGAVELGGVERSTLGEVVELNERLDVEDVVTTTMASISPSVIVFRRFGLLLIASSGIAR